MKKLIFVLVATFSIQAHAWGDREQGILSGAAGVILLQKLFQEPQHQHAPQYSQPPGHRIYTIHPPPPRPVYQEHWQWDPICYCYIKVYTQIGWQ